MNEHLIRVATTDELVAAKKTADLFEFNRRYLPTDLDPGGYHILSLMIFGHDRGMNSDPLHHRVLVLCKITDSDEPFVTHFDIAHDQWDLLPTVADFKQRCDVCGGEGTVPLPDKNASVATSREADVRCRACDGTGVKRGDDV